jgi:hypothetical protein
MDRNQEWLAQMRQSFHADEETAMNAIFNASSFDLVYAGEWEEFFYKETEECVLEGEPIGLDCWDLGGTECDLVLFKDIYWSPN